ncbi:MAG: hypothetical protein ACI358_09270 [Candidatus Limimorpha sp.]
MKRLSLLLVISCLVAAITFSCSKQETPSTDTPYSELIVGRWATDDEGHFEVYNANGTGKMWDPAEDVQEDEADTFTWTIDENNKLTQIINFQSGAAQVPQYCNILLLNETSFKYNNNGWRAEYDLNRITK